MAERWKRLACWAGLVAIPACSPPTPSVGPEMGRKSDTSQIEPLVRSEAEWQAQLSPAEYQVMRRKGTEPKFSGEYVNNKASGVYLCRGCDLPLYSSTTKFESGTGWPSFWDVVKNGHVRYESDTSWGMTRTELLCSRCNSHLGHVFSDGPPPTGMRHCINSVSLKFKPQEEESAAPKP